MFLYLILAWKFQIILCEKKVWIFERFWRMRLFGGILSHCVYIFFPTTSQYNVVLLFLTFVMCLWIIICLYFLWNLERTNRIQTNTELFHKKFKICYWRTVFENHPKCRIWLLQFLHFPPIFVLLELTCLVTLFDRKIKVFKNSPNWLFSAFLMNFCALKM